MQSRVRYVPDPIRRLQGHCCTPSFGSNIVRIGRFLLVGTGDIDLYREQAFIAHIGSSVLAGVLCAYPYEALRT